MHEATALVTLVVHKPLMYPQVIAPLQFLSGTCLIMCFLQDGAAEYRQGIQAALHHCAASWCPGSKTVLYMFIKHANVQLTCHWLYLQPTSGVHFPPFMTATLGVG